ncbi:MAG TPA: hypothetical protein VGF77_03450 [Allosphingosinicella sp.]
MSSISTGSTSKAESRAKTGAAPKSSSTSSKARSGAQNRKSKSQEKDRAHRLGAGKAPFHRHADQQGQRRQQGEDHAARRHEDDQQVEQQEDQPESGAEPVPRQGAADPGQHRGAAGERGDVDRDRDDPGMGAPVDSGADEPDHPLRGEDEKGARDEAGRHRADAAAEPDAAAPAEPEEGKDERTEQPERHDLRRHQQGPAEQIRIDIFLPAGLGRAARKLLGRRQRLAAHLPQAARVERVEPVAGAVVARLVADDRIIEDGPGTHGEHADVGRIGDELVEIRRHRIGDRMRGGAAIGVERAAVRAAGLEHDRRAGDAARLHVDQAVHPRRERIVLEKGRGAEQPRFLALVEQEVDGAARRMRLQQGSDLQHRGDTDPVIGRAGAGRRRIVMRGEEQMGSIFRPKARDDVAHIGAADAPRFGRAVAGPGLRHPRREADAAKLRHQPLPRRIVRLSIDGMGPLVAEHAAEPLQRLLRVESPRRGRGERRRPGQLPLQRQSRDQQQKHGDQSGSRLCHLVPFAPARHIAFPRRLR